jgi:hypothetical protein
MVSQYAQLRLFQRLKLDLLELRYVLSLISIRTIKKTTAHLLYIYFPAPRCQIHEFQFNSHHPKQGPSKVRKKMLNWCHLSNWILS